MELGFAGDQLGLTLLDAVELGQRILGHGVALACLALELLHARTEVARPRRQLELPLVQLSCARDQPFVAPAGFAELGFELCDLLLAGLELRATLSQLTTLGCELPLPLRERFVHRPGFLVARIGLRSLGDPFGCLAFQLLDLRVELARARGELELALIERAVSLRELQLSRVELMRAGQ